MLAEPSVPDGDAAPRRGLESRSSNPGRRSSGWHYNGPLRARRQCWASGRRRHPPPRLDQSRVSCRLRCCDRRARQQRQKFPAPIPRPACATIFSLAYLIGRGARLIPAQCRLRAGSRRSKRRGNRGTANSILRPIGSTISKRMWRTRRRWSHGSSRCCVSSISRKTSREPLIYSPFLSIL
jgi:hypothetical protein